MTHHARNARKRRTLTQQECADIRHALQNAMVKDNAQRERLKALANELRDATCIQIELPKRMVATRQKLSRAGATGLADIIREACRVEGRWRPFAAVSFGSGALRIEFRKELPYGTQYEVTENGAHRRAVVSLEDAILEVSDLEPTLDLARQFTTTAGLYEPDARD